MKYPNLYEQKIVKNFFKYINKNNIIPDCFHREYSYYGIIYHSLTFYNKTKSCNLKITFNIDYIEIQKTVISEVLNGNINDLIEVRFYYNIFIVSDFDYKYIFDFILNKEDFPEIRTFFKKYIKIKRG